MNTFAKLRSKGYRVTNQREIILQKIKDHPQTVEEIHEQLGKKVDLASVYRTLQVLVKNKLVRVINLGDKKKRFEIIDEKNHHHHFTCNNCKSIEDISSQFEEKLIADIQSQARLKIEDHSIELYGLCQDCQV